MLHLPSCLRAFYSFSSATVSERRCSSPLGAASNTVRTGRGNGEMIGVSGLAIRLCLEPRRVGTTSLEMLQRSSSSPPSDSINPFSPLSFSLFLPSSRFNVIRFEVMFGNTIFVKKNETFPTFLLVIVGYGYAVARGCERIIVAKGEEKQNYGKQLHVVRGGNAVIPAVGWRGPLEKTWPRDKQRLF